VDTLLSLASSFIRGLAFDQDPISHTIGGIESLLEKLYGNGHVPDRTSQGNVTTRVQTLQKWMYATSFIGDGILKKGRAQPRVGRACGRTPRGRKHAWTLF